jgi:crotonobetainyl-CoA:carnitine CoA-transferase CaiB-like acyl-CoA transferase
VNVLEGVRVVDTSAYVYGPSAGGVLAHWGADVIKIEPARGFDPIRRSKEPGKGGITYQHYNRSKRAIAVDLKAAEGQAILARLVERADVFLTSALPRVRRSMRIDVDDVRAVNPSIVYAKVTGQGPAGPDAERPGFDLATWWGRGGLAGEAMRVAGIDEPTGMVGHGDGISGLVLAGGICAALLHRAMTGETLTIDGSLLGTALWFNAPAVIASNIPRLPSSWPNTHVERADSPATSNTYRTKDGRWIQLVFFNDSDDYWRDLCEHLGRPELAASPELATTEARTRNRAGAITALESAFAGYTLAELKTVLDGVRATWAPIQLPSEMEDDVQVQANGYLQKTETPIGTLSLPVPALLFDGDGGVPGRAPDYGQHTDAVLSDLGYPPEQIARYRESGVIA